MPPNAIAPVYLAADPSINRAQLEKLNRALDFITSVRNDPYSDESEKISDLEKLMFFQMDAELAAKILTIQEDRWLAIKDEVGRVLELIMRENIRDYQVNEIADNIPGLINYSFSADENQVIQYLVKSFLVPNSLYSELETQKARLEAADKIHPVIKTYAEGQAIVLRGQIITPEQYEALVNLDLVRPEDLSKEYISSAALILVLGAFVVLYFSPSKKSLHFGFTFIIGYSDFFSNFSCCGQSSHPKPYNYSIFLSPSGVCPIAGIAF